MENVRSEGPPPHPHYKKIIFFKILKPCLLGSRQRQRIRRREAGQRVDSGPRDLQLQEVGDLNAKL